MTSPTPSEERDGWDAQTVFRAGAKSLLVAHRTIREQAAEITRLRAEVERAWHPVTELPDEGRKIVAIYGDGSGAPLLWRHDYGFLDQEGEEVSHDWFYGNVSVWAYLPDCVEFWCENLAEDPIRLTLPARMPAEGRAAIEQEGG